MADGGTTPQLVEDFITHWSKAEASERANAQPFLIGLAKILGVPEPSNSHADGYSFEFPVKIPTGPDTVTEGRIDLYRRASFVLEAKQFAAVKDEPTELALALDPAAGKRKAGPVRGSDAWDDAMWKARGQAERYARNLPADESPAPFLLVVDVGHSIEVYADFTQAGRAYTHFPEPRNFRLVALNAARAAEEAAGTIRWLRPEYQAPAGATTQSGLEITTKGTKTAKAKPKTSKTKIPWPKSLAERVRATELALQNSPAPVTLTEIAKRFTHAKPEDLAEILETLATLGRAHRDGDRFST